MRWFSRAAKPVDTTASTLVDIGMDKRTKFLMAGLGAIALLGLLSSFWLFTTSQQTSLNFLQLEQQIRQENSQLRDRLAALEGERRGLEARLTMTTERLGEVQRELETMKSQYADLNARYNTVQVERDQFAGQVDQLSGERSRLQEQIARLTGEKTALEQSATELKRTLDRLEQENRRLTERMDDLTHRLTSGVAGGAVGVGAQAGAMQTIELPPIVVQQGGGQAIVTGPVQGKIIQIDQEHQFVVINKGSRDGIRQGSTFQISRSGTPLGKVTALRVRETVTACDIARSSVGGALAIGDQALLLQ